MSIIFLNEVPLFEGSNVDSSQVATSSIHALIVFLNREHNSCCSVKCNVLLICPYEAMISISET